MSLTERQKGENRRTLVVGDDAVGVLAARQAPGTVTFVGLNEQVLQRVDDAVSASVVVDPQRFEPPTESIDAAIVATKVDSLNLLYAQRLRVDGGVSDIVARVCDPHYESAFADIGVDTVCTAREVSDSLVETSSRLTV